MLAGGTGLGEVNHEGEPLVVFYDSVDLTGWALGVVIPRRLLAQIIVKEVILNIFIAAAFILGIIVVMSQLIRRLLAPPWSDGGAGGAGGGGRPSCNS